MGGGTHLVVMGTGDSGRANSTYAVTMACTDELVTWLCHIVVVVGRCTGGWGWSMMGGSGCWRRVKQVGGRIDGGGG